MNFALCNILFPAWAFYLLPTQIWLVLLPGNFLIDSLVLIIAMRVYNVTDKWKIWRASIFFIWIFGFIADFIGALAVMGLNIVFADGFSSLPLSLLLAIPGIALTSIIIYFLNYWVSFRKTPLQYKYEQIHKLCKSIAIFTAPYTFLIPWEWIN